MATKTKTKPVAPALSAEEITALVDKIGNLKATLAPQLEQLDADLKILKAMGVERYIGDKFEVNVFDKTDSRLDMEAVREKLSPQFIAAHTTTKIVRTAKVAARMLPSVQ